MKKSANKCTMESLRMIVALIREWIDFWWKPENDPDANIVAKGNHKTGVNIPVFNLPMILTCGNCGACKRWCYVVKSYLSKLGNWMPSAKGIAKSVTRNMVAIQKKGTKYFIDRMTEQIVKTGCRFMRVHAQGDFDLEIPGEEPEAYMMAWAQIAKNVYERTGQRIEVPVKTADGATFVIKGGTVTLAFTKEFDTVRELVRRGILPNNPKDIADFPLQIVLSEWADELKAPEDLVAMGYHTSRAVYDVADVRPDEFLCPGNCESCGMCWRLNSLKEVRGTAFEVH